MTDHLGRETGNAPEARTVTEFAVEQGTLAADAPGVAETLEEEEQRRKVHTEHAERVAGQLSTQDDTKDDGGQE